MKNIVFVQINKCTKFVLHGYHNDISCIPRQLRSEDSVDVISGDSTHSVLCSHDDAVNVYTTGDVGDSSSENADNGLDWLYSRQTFASEFFSWRMQTSGLQWILSTWDLGSWRAQAQPWPGIDLDVDCIDNIVWQDPLGNGCAFYSNHPLKCEVYPSYDAGDGILLIQTELIWIVLK